VIPTNLNVALKHESTAAKKYAPVLGELSQLPIMRIAIPLMEVIEDVVKKVMYSVKLELNYLQISF
jgi:hypothetical protein